LRLKAVNRAVLRLVRKARRSLFVAADDQKRFLLAGLHPEDHGPEELALLCRLQEMLESSDLILQFGPYKGIDWPRSRCPLPSASGSS
jgi:hypothetical protein